jgi:crotonobetaine/carnitine-CoA ligase
MDVTGARTLHRILSYHADTRPDATFLSFEGADSTEEYTFAQIEKAANRFAHSLRSLGLSKGDRINLHLGNRPEFIIAWLGASKLGVSVVPTNPAFSANEWRYIVEHSKARVLLVEPAQLQAALELRDQLAMLRSIIVCGPEAEGLAFDAFLAGGDDRDPGVKVSADDECAVNYTSGTTSRPKGIVTTHANYVYAGEAQGRHICLRPDDRYLVVLPFFHASGQTHSTIPALVFGASIAVMHRFSASRYFDQVLRYDVTLGSLFAAPIRMILSNPVRAEHRKSRMRLALYAQNVTTAQLDEWERRYGVPLIQIWGMTETMSLPVMEPVCGPRKRMSMGMAIYGYELRVVDPTGKDVAPGTVGELVVRGVPGRTMMKEYLDNPQATAETIRGEWLYSGDNVRMDEDGYFFFVDRGKDLIKRAGENVSASEVEAVIREHPDVMDAAVIGVPDPMLDEVVKALVIRKASSAIGEADVFEWCRARLTPFKVPALVEFCEDFPRTSVGKIQKHLLRAEQRRRDRPT